MRKHHIRTKYHDRAIELYRSGLGVKRVCAALGIPARRHTVAITRWVKAAGVFEAGRKPPGGNKSAAQRTYETSTLADIASVTHQEKQYAKWYLKAYDFASAERRKAIIKKQELRKMRTPHLRIKFYLRKRLRHAALQQHEGGKQYTLRSADMFGCTPRELRRWIQKQWREGMTWDNYGTKGWHIDHRKPCSSFNLLDSEEAKRCFHYTNLRPMWARDNMAKGDKTVVPSLSLPSPLGVRGQSEFDVTETLH